MATLKISDLSVDDWVQDGIGIIAKVRGIENWSDGYRLNVQTVSGSILDFSATGALPIPITAEILEKNEFMLLSDSFSTYEYATLLGKMLRSTRVYLDAPQAISVSLQDTTIERGFYHREKTSVRILRDELYVHDLQHALRLAGVDKEINL